MKRHQLPDRSVAQRLANDLFAQPPAIQAPGASSPLVLYGAGKLGQLALRLLQNIGIDVPFIVDRKPPATGQLLGVPVICPEAVAPDERQHYRLGICIVTSPYEPIRQSLQAEGWRNIWPIYDLLQRHADRTTMENGWSLPPPNATEKAQLLDVLTLWHDDISRAAHLQFLAWRYLREEWSFDRAPVHIDNRYFIAEIIGLLRSDEFFLDAGAYDGAVSKRFAELTEGKFQQIAMIEADSANLHMLRQNIDAMPFAQRVSLFPCALDATSGQASFAANHDLGSRLHSAHASMVTTRRLDDLALPITFAKYHLEGHELAALRGSLATLEKCRPLLAITVYHNADGAARTAHFLQTNLKDYRFHMRLHGWCGTAAVIYAIPNERQLRTSG